VAGALDDPQAGAGDPGRQLALALGREQEVVAPGHHQRRHRDLAEAVHHRPAREQVAAGEDQRLRPRLEAPPAAEQVAEDRPRAGVVGVGTADPQEDRPPLPRRELAVEPAPDQLHLLGAVAALGEELERVLP
jgi:hypothetical protein